MELSGRRKVICWMEDSGGSGEKQSGGELVLKKVLAGTCWCVGKRAF